MSAIQEDVDRINQIRDEMLTLLEEARFITRTAIPDRYANLKAYVFDQIGEHLEKANPYNQDMSDVATAIEEEIGSDEEENEEDITDDKNETWANRDVPNPADDI